MPDLDHRVALAQGWIYAEIPDMLDPLLRAEISKWWVDGKSGITRHLIDRYHPSTNIAQAMAFAQYVREKGWRFSLEWDESNLQAHFSKIQEHPIARIQPTSLVYADETSLEDVAGAICTAGVMALEE